MSETGILSDQIAEYGFDLLEGNTFDVSSDNTDDFIGGKSPEFDSSVVYRTIDLTDIVKIRNARNVPFDFDQIAEIGNAIGIDLSLDKAKTKLKKHLALIQGEPVEKDVLAFMLSLHELGQSMREGQISPVVVCRANASDINYQLIAGERRVCASFYAGLGQIDSKIYNHIPTEAELLRIMDDENAQREDLSLADKIKSRKERYDLMVEREESVTVRSLAAVIKSSSATAALYKRIFDYDQYSYVLELVRTGKLKSLRKAVAYIAAQEDATGDTKAAKSTSSIQKAYGVATWSQETNTKPYKRIMTSMIGDVSLDVAEGIYAMDSLSNVELQALFVKFVSELDK